jgi:hypothetical protein
VTAKDPADYPIPAVRFAGGRTLHWVKDPGERHWGGTLQAACGKSGRQGDSYGFRQKPMACNGCRKALDLPTPTAA